MQHTANILSAIFDQLFHFKYPRLFVLALQFLESQSYDANAGFIRAFEG